MRNGRSRKSAGAADKIFRGRFLDPGSASWHRCAHDGFNCSLCRLSASGGTTGCRRQCLLAAAAPRTLAAQTPRVADSCSPPITASAPAFAAVQSALFRGSPMRSRTPADPSRSSCSFRIPSRLFRPTPLSRAFLAPSAKNSSRCSAKAANLNLPKSSPPMRTRCPRTLKSGRRRKPSNHSDCVKEAGSVARVVARDPVLPFTFGAAWGLSVLRVRRVDRPEQKRGDCTAECPSSCSS